MISAIREFTLLKVPVKSALLSHLGRNPVQFDLRHESDAKSATKTIEPRTPNWSFSNNYDAMNDFETEPLVLSLDIEFVYTAKLPR